MNENRISEHLIGKTARDYLRHLVAAGLPAPECTEVCGAVSMFIVEKISGLDVEPLCWVEYQEIVEVNDKLEAVGWLQE